MEMEAIFQRIETPKREPNTLHHRDKSFDRRMMFSMGYAAEKRSRSVLRDQRGGMVNFLEQFKGPHYCTVLDGEPLGISVKSLRGS